MGEQLGPVTDDHVPKRPASHQGILVLMGAVTAVFTVAGFVFGGIASGVGVIFGGLLSFVNYFWLASSTRAIFVNAETASTALLAIKYILRYIVIGAIVLLIYWMGIMPVAAVILGLSAFAFAVVLQGLKTIISSSN